MAVVQISKICIKKGSINYLPDSLDEAEMCFTTDTGEIFIGAPNFNAIQYRSSESNGSNILPYRNIKILTEFDITRTLTGDFYTNGPLDNVTVPVSTDGTAHDLYTFDQGINSIIISYSLYDGQNVNAVGDLYISLYQGKILICKAGQDIQNLTFGATYNTSTQKITLNAINSTNSIYTMYLATKCWQSSLATWDGVKGNGESPECSLQPGDGSGGSTTKVAIQVCDDVKLTDLADGQFLQYNATDKMWENVDKPSGGGGGVAAWIVQDNITTAGSSASNAAQITVKDANIGIVRNAAIVQTNAISAATYDARTDTFWYQNTGPTLVSDAADQYNSNGHYLSTLSGGTGTGAIGTIGLQLYRTVNTFKVTTGTSLGFYFGGTRLSASVFYGYSQSYINSSYTKTSTDGTWDYYSYTGSSTTNPEANSYIQGPNVGNSDYMWNNTGGYYVKVGLYYPLSYLYFFGLARNGKNTVSIDGKIVSGNGGGGYTVGDVVTVYIPGTPIMGGSFTKLPTFTVTAVTTTPPSGLILPKKNSTEMFIVSNHSSNGFIVYPPTGDTFTDGGSSYTVNGTDKEVKFVKNSDDTWTGF